MKKYMIETDDTTIIRIKLLAMYFTDEQKELAEQEGHTDIPYTWTEAEVLEYLVRDQIGNLSDDGVDFSSYYKKLVDEGIVKHGDIQK